MSEPDPVAERLAAQQKEYGTFVAVAPINYQGARAFNPGMPVPASHVEQFGYDEQGLVKRVDAGPAPAAAPAPAPAAPQSTSTNDPKAG